MVVIRLARYGQKHSPKYRVMVADSRRWAGGRFIEILGHYNPVARGNEKELELDVSKAKAWISKGAQPSKTVQGLIKKAEAQSS